MVTCNRRKSQFRATRLNTQDLFNHTRGDYAEYREQGSEGIPLIPVLTYHPSVSLAETILFPRRGRSSCVSGLSVGKRMLLVINSCLGFWFGKHRFSFSFPVSSDLVKSVRILIGEERGSECRMNANSYVQMRFVVAALRANVLLEKILTTGSRESHWTIDRPVNGGTRESDDKG